MDSFHIFFPKYIDVNTYKISFSLSYEISYPLAWFFFFAKQSFFTKIKSFLPSFELNIF